jgi:hypothetical protein
MSAIKINSKVLGEKGNLSTQTEMCKQRRTVVQITIPRGNIKNELNSICLG